MTAVMTAVMTVVMTAVDVATTDADWAVACNPDIER